MPIFSHPALLRLANDGALSQADLMAVFGTWIDESGTLDSRPALRSYGPSRKTRVDL